MINLILQYQARNWYTESNLIKINFTVLSAIYTVALKLGLVNDSV
jgi:hypothetical protein